MRLQTFRNAGTVARAANVVGHDLLQIIPVRPVERKNKEGKVTLRQKALGQKGILSAVPR